MCGVGVRRGFAWCVRSQVVGMATRRGARDETGARPAQAMRLTANTKRKTVTVDAHGSITRFQFNKLITRTCVFSFNDTR